jgi:ornithine cyclodeaminase/alanine dehydrogenase-like protein (mu-crystallin family)
MAGQNGSVTSTPPSTRLLSRTQVRSLLRWPGLIDATAQALIDASGGASSMAAASQLHVPGAALHLKSGALAQPPILTVKANLRPQAGGAAGLIVAFDPVRHTVRAVLDSADITAARTGAIAAVAARQLAGPGPHTLALLGAGPVARQSLAALSQVVELAEVRVWSRDRSRSAKFSDETALATAVGSVERAVAGADLVLTATPAREPLLTGADLADQAVVLAMGADTRGKRELGDGVLDGAELVADVPADAAEVGELAYLPGGPDPARCVALGDLLAGRRQLPAGRRIVFDSVGTAVADAAAVALVLAVAEAEQIGTLFDFTALQAVPERVHGDPFDDLAAPNAVDLGLQVGPDANVDRQDADQVADGGRRPGDGQHAMLLGQPGDGGVRAARQVAVPVDRVLGHGQRLVARVHGHPRSPVAGADHGGQHGDRDLFRRAGPAGQGAQVVVDVGAGPDLGDAVGRGQVAGGERGTGRDHAHLVTRLLQVGPDVAHDGGFGPGHLLDAELAGRVVRVAGVGQDAGKFQPGRLTDLPGQLRDGVRQGADPAHPGVHLDQHVQRAPGLAGHLGVAVDDCR